jgi:predicted TIM-barrel fold metal-dependent hydrolase
MSTSSRRKFIAFSSLASLGALGSWQLASAQKTQTPGKTSDLLDLSEIPVIDHHSHGHDPVAMQKPESWNFTSMFYHGIRDDGSMPEGSNQMSDALKYHISQTGVVLAAVAQLSQLYGCPDTLEAVVAARHKRIMEDSDGYIKFLYNKAKISAIVYDGQQLGVANPTSIPSKVWHLVPNDAIFKESLKKSDSLASFRKTFLEGISATLKDKKYIAVKNHIGENFGLAVYEIPVSEVEAVFANAKKGDTEAIKKVYLLSFNDLSHYCCEQGVPIHIHTGTTGDLFKTPLAETYDPFLLIPYLGRPELKRLKLVLLHAGNPWIRHAAHMAYNFPNVYLDMGWVFPWTALAHNLILEEVMSIAPLSKVFYGAGCHTGPEPAYIGAMVIKRTLASALSNLIEDKYLTKRQAEEIAHQILHRNVENLYNV